MSYALEISSRNFTPYTFEALVVAGHFGHQAFQKT